MQSALGSDRIQITNYMKDTFRSDMRRDILRGLTSKQKAVPSKYFYDAYGSQLFGTICSLPEYYQTRTELSLIRNAAPRIVQDLCARDIVELGSGANLKTRKLLDACFSACPADICYVPIDVSEQMLLESSSELIDSYPDLKIRGIVGDFTKHIEKIPLRQNKLFVFFGSTIGNFSGKTRTSLLKSVAGAMGPDDRFLLGLDMIKPADVLERAYNDSRGVTAEFNKNMLNVLNRELNADFERSHFEHVAFYNSDKEQIEMHLRANRTVTVNITDIGVRVAVEKGETIHTEVCGKFSRKSAEVMAEEAGLKIQKWYEDPAGWFSLVELGTR